MSGTKTHGKSVKEGPKSRPKIVQSPNLVTFYANSARVAFSEYDVRVYFSEQVPPNPSDSNSKSTVVDRVCVIMAPKYAEEFVENLDHVLDDYRNLLEAKESPAKGEGD